MQVDVLMVADPRFPGGTSTSLAAESRALAEASYRVALVPVAGPVLRSPHPVHPDIAAEMAAGRLGVVMPGTRVQARLCLLQHPQVFARYPLEPWDIVADRTLMVVHHPPADATGAAIYDPAAIQAVVGDLLGAVTWAPVGTLVRRAFGRRPAVPLLARDWVNVIDADALALERRGLRSGRPVVGRHGRPDPAKWPSTRARFTMAYPDAPDIAVRLMGWGAALDAVVGRPPANWDLLPFGAMEVRSFLAGLDFYAHYHSDAWVEAFGRSIAEAVAAGVVAILPPHFREVFGPAAIYATEADVAATVRRLHADPEAMAEQAETALAHLRETWGPGRAVERVADLIDAPAAGRIRSRVPAAAAAERKVLFVTSNGVGMGHLTRTLAIARRLPAGTVPVVASMSRAFGVAAEMGIEATYLAYHRSVGLEETLWHAFLEQEMRELLGHHAPRAVVFDGNVPYDGMMAALSDWRGIWRVWCRRGMWAPGTGAQHMAREAMFDAVLEPGEIAAPFDRGLTAEHRGRTVPLAPVRLLHDGEALSREAARAELGVPEAALSVLLLPGSETNFDLSVVRRQVLDRFCGRPGVTLTVAEWGMREQAPELPEGVRRLSGYPFARLFAGVDLAVATAGYNGFHELLHAGVPTLFVANESPEQDEQVRRGDYAALRGLALAARVSEPARLAAALDRLEDPGERARLRAACASLDPDNGATAAAAWLEQLCLLRRVAAD